ncbi:MAG: Gfo/Idh/MocA family oxidoreductase [Clostridiales bacterium]|nr:Gfo/Idh/MocA family oxidoreductase [Clostridiales bacterium]
MKVCFIGNCGHSSQAYKVLNQRNGVVFAGFAPGSEHEKSAPAYAQGWPLYDSYLEMLEKEKPDLAVISPVFGLTAQVILDCAARKIDIFSEKPVATTLEELNRVEKAVKESGIRFCAMHYLRYHPAFYLGAELVKQGAIGDVRMITAQKSYRFGTRPEWYWDKKLYGGTIPWVGIHAIDWIAHFSGKKYLSVTGQSFGGSPEMAALCQFEMEDGVMAAINLDYYRPAKAPTHGDDRVRCAGTKGVLEVRDGKVLLMNEEGNQVLEPEKCPELLEEFLDGKQPIPVEEIFHLTRAAIAAREAADTGKKVKI